MQGVCNTYLSQDSTFNRLVYVVKSLANAGFYVVLVRSLEGHLMSFGGILLLSVQYFRPQILLTLAHCKLTLCSFERVL